MTERYEVAIAGGAPAGSAAAWKAIQSGARVILLDKAEFPRDKPCGDGLTPRAVSYLQKMGLADRMSNPRLRAQLLFWEKTMSGS